MDNSTERSCWSFAGWTLAAFGGALVIAFLVGAFEPALVTAKAD